MVYGQFEEPILRYDRLFKLIRLSLENHLNLSCKCIEIFYSFGLSVVLNS